MRLIDADKLKEDFNQEDWGTYNDSDVKRIIDNAPTVDVFSEIDGLNNQIDDLSENLAWYINERNRLLKEQRPHGKWLFGGFCVTTTRYICNQCTIPNLEKTNFCPNCGADMRSKS